MKCMNFLAVVHFSFILQSIIPICLCPELRLPITDSMIFVPLEAPAVPVTPLLDNGMSIILRIVIYFNV